MGGIRLRDEDEWKEFRDRQLVLGNISRAVLKATAVENS